MNDILIRVMRNKKSYNYKYDIMENNYSNNIKNNSLDYLQIIKNDKVELTIEGLQTVANHPDYDFQDTIKPGKFKIKCFVDPRNFHGRIHGIIEAKDIENQVIDKYSMQIEDGYQKGRWLVHDRWSFAKNRDLHNGYSGGCFIMSSIALKAFNDRLEKFGIKKGDLIDCALEEFL
jgi:hypothetical protein